MVWAEGSTGWCLGGLGFDCEDVELQRVSGATTIWFLCKRVGTMVSRMGCCAFLHLVLA
jgi:hypothetical protein